MNLYADHIARRAVFEVLAKVPEGVRAFGLERVAVVGVGRETAGTAIHRAALGEAEWLVVVAERGGVDGTFAHEIGHAWLGHRVGSADAEREAARLAASWGFSGCDSADPAGCAARYEAAQKHAEVRARIEDGRLGFWCRCGARCRLICPTVPGRVAELALVCDRCASTLIRELSDLTLCETCGAPANVTWAEGATPAEPLATWTCSACGNVIERALVVAPDPAPIPGAGPEVPEWAWATGIASRTLLALEEAARRPSEDLGGAAMEGWRSSMSWALGLARRAAGVLADDPRGKILDAVAVELAAAARELQDGDLPGCADAIARSNHSMLAVLASATPAAAEVRRTAT
jgi:hypothetical protein